MSTNDKDSFDSDLEDDDQEMQLCLKTPVKKLDLTGKGAEFEVCAPTNHAAGDEGKEETLSDFSKLLVNADEPIVEESRIDKDISDKQDGGILKRVTRAGWGDNVEEGSEVQFRYSIRVDGLDEPIDCNYSRRTAKRAKMGTGRLLPCVEKGLSSMCVGEKCVLHVAPIYGFGAVGCPPRIPPETQLIVLLELCWVGQKEHPYDQMTKEQQQQLTVKEVLSYVEEKRRAGKQFFAIQKYGSACNRFCQARKLLENADKKKFNKEGMRKQRRDDRFLLSQNLCICYGRLSEQNGFDRNTCISRALTYCAQAHKLKPNEAKVLYHWTKLLFNEGRYEEALEKGQQAQRLNPYSEELMELVKRVNDRVQMYKTESEQIAKRMCAANIGTVGPQSSASETDDFEDPTTFVSERFQEHVDKLLLDFEESTDTELYPDRKIYSEHELTYLFWISEARGYAVGEPLDVNGNFSLKLTKSS